MTTHILIGIPASGKSTFTVQNFSDFKVISPDNIRSYITGQEDNFSEEEKVWSLVYQLLAWYARTERDVVIDATAANGPLRRKLCKYLKSLGATVNGIYLHTKISVALERNRKRYDAGGRFVPERIIVKMAKSLLDDPPKTEDGFDSLIIIENV
jgi:predicted kinase